MNIRSWAIWGLSSWAWLGGVVTSGMAQEKLNGEQIYKQMCARCHGLQGEGTPKYTYPLTGEWSIQRLATYIDRTMPEDDPDKLDAAGARAVAEYIYDAFYSPPAYARLHPPRRELARLTARQFRNSIADWIGTFRPPVRLDDRFGLRAEYYNSRNFNPKSRLIDRTDALVYFDFGVRGPDTDTAKFDPHQFSIRWEGAIIAPDTGEYEMIIRTDHAARLWLNDLRKPLIDAWVKSGDDTEYRERIYLLAGRAYPLRLEFSKAKQGVDDSKKNPNPPPKPASIALLWKRPGRPPEIVPQRYLYPQRTPEVAVIDTPFPPDDRSFGWERGTNVSKEWQAAVTEAALTTANYVAERLPELASLQRGNRSEQLRRFAERLVERAFRRPLTPSERELYVERQITAAGGDESLAIKRIVLLAMQSPRFLFPEAAELPPHYAIASRLALVLWDSLPDGPLWEAAASGKLDDPAELRRQIDRMLDDPRAKAKLRQFLLAWLGVEHPKELSKDPQHFPGFDAHLVSDLRTSLELFIDEWLSRPDADIRQLFTVDEIYCNQRMARFYGVNLPTATDPRRAEVEFYKVRFEPEHRLGVITHPYLLATLAYSGESSPIHRGVYIGRAILGLHIRPPMDAFTPLSPELHPKLTTRQRVELQTRPPECAKCHAVMNPLGFPLEHFDAAGRYRALDRGQPVDASGQYETRTGEVVRFRNAKELAQFLASSPEVHQAFATQLFHHLVKQSIRAYGVHRPEELHIFLSQNGYSWRKLIKEIAIVAATLPK